MNKEQITRELQFKASRSSGAGGQHVNKVSSKIGLIFSIKNSTGLSIEEKERVSEKLSSRLTKENTLILNCDESRSQHKNKELVIKRFFEIIENALLVPKIRKKTKRSKKANEKRLKLKKLLGSKKASREKPFLY